MLPEIRLSSLCACLALACATSSPSPTPSAQPEKPVRLGGLGPHTRTISTKSSEAQQWFNQGLALLFAFNHDEAIRSFEKAGALDPSSAMAAWGVAIANGPHINFPMVPEDRARAAWAATGRAQSLLSGSSPVERDMVSALGKRYAMPQPPDRRPLDEAYAKAMRNLRRAHPEDADIGALFAEALMDLRPWDLWTAEGKPQPGTDEIVATLEAVLAKSPQHPLGNHLYIHAVEASPHPEKGDLAAETLRNLQPGLGHMVHMPTHIDVRRGRWQQAIDSNRRAMESDAAYRAQEPRQGFYRMYMAHNHHMLTFAAMMTGQGELALRTFREMIANIPADFLKENALFIDGYVGMLYEVMIRFGHWSQILAEAEPADYLPTARAMRHYARGVARAATGKVAEARAEQAAFRTARTKLAADAPFGNNKASDVLDIADKLLEGEILYRDHDEAAAFTALRESVAKEDRLRYDEPPDWIQPVRHALGAALLKSGKVKEAEAVFREDLDRLPGNVWSLVGLARSLKAQKRTAEMEAVEAKLKDAAKNADVKLTTSCLCLPGV